MFTLKISQHRYLRTPEHPPTLADESTVFVAADRVEVHASLDDPHQVIAAWAESQTELHDYLDVTTGSDQRIVTSGPNSTWSASGSNDPGPSECTYHPGRLIRTDIGDTSQWWLCSRAWLLGPNGSTIERVAP